MQESKQEITKVISLVKTKSIQTPYKICQQIIDCLVTCQPLWVVSSPREREKRDSRGDEREGQGRKRNRNESEETEDIKTFSQYLYLLQGQQAWPNCKPILVGRPGDVRYSTPAPYLTTPYQQINP